MNLNCASHLPVLNGATELAGASNGLSCLMQAHPHSPMCVPPPGEDVPQQSHMPVRLGLTVTKSSPRELAESCHNPSGS